METLQPDPDIGNCPTSLRVVGRSANRENSDICGKYVYKGILFGRAVYQHTGSSTVIRYWPPLRRWVIDREGLRESDVCVAFAADTLGSEHPAHTELLWHVWEPSAQAHVPDSEVISVAAPQTITLVGRAFGKENSIVNGRYELRGLCHGRPAYIHENGNLVIRYLQEEHRWAIAPVDEVGNNCLAYAEAGLSTHPGVVDLLWWFYEPQWGIFLQDVATRSMLAPALLHVVGRMQQAENSRINGTYLLAGVHDGRPLYVQPGTCSLIRYSSRSDRWLIDNEGLAKPSLASRLYYWIMRGDPHAAEERCSAFADADGTDHPGFAALQWHVWVTSRGSHIYDPAVCATCAPLALQVRGRAPDRENGDINGDYVLVGAHCGRPAYQKTGTLLVIRYWPPMNRWVISRQGFQATDACVAFAEGMPDATYPAEICSQWHVYESSRGCHLPDPYVQLRMSTGDDSLRASTSLDLAHQLPLSMQQLQQWRSAADVAQASRKDVSLDAGAGIRLQQGFFGA